MTPNSLFRASLLFAIIAAFPANQVHASTYQITKVINGQTIRFDNDGKIETARLIGIDTPGRSKSPHHPEQLFAASARNYLAITVLNRDVDIKAYGFDADGLLLVEVFVEDRNINLSMLRAGLA